MSNNTSLSIREQLKRGLFNKIKTPLKSMHQFIGKFTTDEHGYCDYEVSESDYFLLKTAGTILSDVKALCGKV